MSAVGEVVWVVMQSWGTCPSDSMDVVHSVYATRELADAFVADQPEPSYGGPYYTVEEHRLHKDPSTVATSQPNVATQDPEAVPPAPTSLP